MSDITNTEIPTLEKVEQVSKELDFQRFSLDEGVNLLVIKTAHREPTVWWFQVESVNQYTPVSASAHYDGPTEEGGTFEETLENFIKLKNQAHEEAEIIEENDQEVQKITEDLQGS